MKLYGLYGPRSGDFLTHGGKVIVHGYEGADRRAKAELEFLCPGAVVREVPRDVPADQCLPLPMHPHLVGIVTFPLDRNQFRRSAR